jgi:tRNA threonylcarbamoyladenosine biosynthesis protein TsaE
VRQQLATAADTRAWGARFAAQLEAGDVVLLFGPLGAGKTTLVGGIAAGLGADDEVVSPTYTLLEVYQGRWPIFHFDFYRIEGPEELRATDPREYFSLGVTLMEWPERVRTLWPRRRWEIELAYAGNARTLNCRQAETPAP